MKRQKLPSCIGLETVGVTQRAGVKFLPVVLVYASAPGLTVWPLPLSCFGKVGHSTCAMHVGLLILAVRCYCMAFVEASY